MAIYDNVNDVFVSAAHIAEFVVSRNYPNSPVVISHEDIPESYESYVVVYPLGITPLQRKWHSTLADENEIITIQANYEMRVQYSFVGPASLGMAMMFSQAIDNNVVVREELIKNNLHIRYLEDLKNAPQKRETGWTDTFVVDVHYGLALTSKQQVTTVGTIRLVDPLTGEQIEITEA